MVGVVEGCVVAAARCVVLGVVEEDKLVIVVGGGEIASDGYGVGGVVLCGEGPEWEVGSYCGGH